MGTIVAFQVSRRDAKRIGREFVDTDMYGRQRELEDEKLLALETGQAWCKVGTSCFRLRTRPSPGAGSPKRRKAALEASRRNYGASPVTPSPGRRDSVEPSDFWE